MLNKDNIEIIYPGIMVFRNGISNSDKIIEELSNYKDWEKWYDIGEQIIMNPMSYHRFENFPKNKEWENSWETKRDRIQPVEIKNLVDTFENYFFEATEHYNNHYKYELPNWVHAASNILRYEGRDAKPEEIKGESKVLTSHDTTKGQAGGTKEMTLPFHTDFYQREEFKPGLKAEYTVTMYLNENYEGGEIDFRIFNRPESDMRMVDGELKSADPDHGEIPAIMYKPQAGDIIIFPSRVPYYHGVRRVTQGMKYFVRMFWMSVLEEV